MEKIMHLPFPSEVEHPELLSPLVLAYLGDAVLELYVRNYLVAQGTSKVNSLHKNAVQLVKAQTQSKLLRKIEKDLSEEELNIAKRGRNAKSGHVPKNADMIEYRYSTGLESLLGYLYLKQNFARLEHIFQELLEIVFNEG